MIPVYPVRVYRAPRPEDTDTDAMSLRLRQRLRLRRTDGSVGPLFVPLPLYDRTNARRDYPGQLQALATAQADDMNEVQIRILEAVGQLDRDVDLLIARLRAEIGGEVNRFRRVHEGFIYATSVQAPPGGTDPNPDDLFDVLQRQTRAYFKTSVDALVEDFNAFWLGPPTSRNLPQDGGLPRKTQVDTFEAVFRAEIDTAFAATFNRWKTYDDLKYSLLLRLLRIVYPYSVWPSLYQFDPLNPQAHLETDAYHVWRTVVPGVLPPDPVANNLLFMAWLGTDAALPYLAQSFPYT